MSRRPAKRARKPAKASKPRPRVPTGLSISGIAAELGVARDTVRARLTAGGVSPDGPLRWRDVVRAMSGGDWRAERTRLLRAQADREEHDLQVARRDVASTEEVVAWIRESFAPVREQAVAMPSKLAPIVNPTDPAHARGHLEAWVEMFLQHVRERGGRERGGREDEK